MLVCSVVQFLRSVSDSGLLLGPSTWEIQREKNMGEAFVVDYAELPGCTWLLVTPDIAVHFLQMLCNLFQSNNLKSPRGHSKLLIIIRHVLTTLEPLLATFQNSTIAV